MRSCRQRGYLPSTNKATEKTGELARKKSAIAFHTHKRHGVGGGLGAGGVGGEWGKSREKNA